jgi:hypothetical protein
VLTQFIPVIDEKAPPLNEKEEAPKGERNFWLRKKKSESGTFAKKRRGLCLRFMKGIFPAASEKGVSDDISFFVFQMLNRPSSGIFLSNGCGRTVGEGRKEERWSLPQKLIYLFL